MPSAGSSGSRTIAFGSFAATSSISMPPDFETIIDGSPRPRSSVIAEVELAVDVERLLDQDLLDDAALRARSAA